MDARKKYPFIKHLRTKGTVTYTVRNYVAGGVITFGVVAGLIAHFSLRGFLEPKIDAGYFENSEGEKLRMARMFGVPSRSLLSSELYKEMEERKEPAVDYD